MIKSESITHLATALAKAQAEMPVAIFDAANPFLKSKYATLGSVIQASRPLLAKHKLSLVQFPISCPLPSDGRGDGAQGTARPFTEFIGVESILAHESGEFVAERIVIPLTEEKGKSKVQAAGSALTYLRRYSWAAILGMYSDEDADGSSPAQAFAQPPATTLPPPPVPTRKTVSRN